MKASNNWTKKTLASYIFVPSQYDYLFCSLNSRTSNSSPALPLLRQVYSCQAFARCSRKKPGRQSLSAQCPLPSSGYTRRSSPARPSAQQISAAMPHAVMPRVSTFFRNHASSFDVQTDLKKAKRRSSSTRRPAYSDRTPSSSGSSLASEDRSIKMPESHKRLSLVGLHSPKSSSSKIPQIATLDVTIESPPLVFFGPAASSSGALLSGQLVLNIHEDLMAIESFKMRLALEVTRKKPFHAHCQECSKQCTDLTTWTFLQGPATLRRGEFERVFLLRLC